MGFSRASCVILKESGPIVRRFANDARKVSGPFVRRYATDDARKIPENSGRTLKEPVVNEVPNNVNKVPFLSKVLVAASIIAPCLYFSK